MKKTSKILFAAAALLGVTAGVADAQTFHQLLPGALIVDANLAGESEYVYRGKEHSDFNLQTALAVEYPLPMPATAVGIALTGGVFSMNPIKQTPNLLDCSLGAKVSYADFVFKARWTYHSFPNQQQLADLPAGGETFALANRAVYNRSNEVYVGVGTAVSGTQLEAGLYYDFNLDQVVLEANISRTFTTPVIPYGALILKGFAGYLDASAYNGDQRAPGVEKWRNGYAYAGLSIDAAYRINEFSIVGVGVRYAWNNDGGSQHDARLEGNTRSNLWWGFWVQFSY